MPAVLLPILPPPEARPQPGLLLSGRTLRQWVASGLDLLFPPRCAGCEKVDTYWCEACQQDIDRISYPPLRAYNPESALTMVAATGPHENKLQRALWVLKYENGREISRPLGQRLAARLKSLDWAVDTLIPVPLHITRFKARGYNQAELLASVISDECGIPMFAQAIERQIETHSQVGLNAKEREANMQGAFRADTAQVAGKVLLLIDDVFTTGATLEACAQAALEAGATTVYGLTVTKA